MKEEMARDYKSVNRAMEKERRGRNYCVYFLPNLKEIQPDKYTIIR